MKSLFLSALMAVGTLAVSAQTENVAYTYVQQNGNTVTADGLAAFALTYDNATTPTVAFDNGNAVITMGSGSVTVAKLPMKNGGQFVVDFENSSSIATANELNVKVKTTGYASLYSPFQLKVKENKDKVGVYAPTFDSDKQELGLTSNTQVADSKVIPVCQALVLKKDGGSTENGVTFVFSTEEPAKVTSVLGGSSLKITKPAGKTFYTLGKSSTSDIYGFLIYDGTYLNPGKAYLAQDIAGSAKSFIGFAFDNNEIQSVNVKDACLANDAAYNVMGQRVNAGAKGIVIVNGKKYINK